MSKDRKDDRRNPPKDNSEAWAGAGVGLLVGGPLGALVGYHVCSNDDD